MKRCSDPSHTVHEASRAQALCSNIKGLHCLSRAMGTKMADQLFPLLDTPQAWLARFAIAAHPPEQLQMLCSCTRLRDTVLATAKKVHLSLSPSRAAGPSMRLLAAWNPEASVKLTIQGERGQDCCEINTQFLQQLCAMRNAATSPPSNSAVPPLHRVTHLELQGDFTGGLLPSYVVEACPNLQHLTRPGRFSCLCLAASTAPVACPQMHTLTLTELELPSIAETDSVMPRFKSAQQQLQKQFVNLRTLHLGEFVSDQTQMVLFEWLLNVKCWASVLTPLHPRVTSLHVHAHFALNGTRDATPWQALRQLHVSGNIPLHLGYLMKAAPHLEQLNVWGFEAREYDDQECSWQQLQLTIRGPLTFMSLATLPLSSLRVLRLSRLHFPNEVRECVQMAHLFLAKHRNTVAYHTVSEDGPLLVNVDAQYSALPAVVSLLQLLQPVAMRVTVPVHTLLQPPPPRVIGTPEALLPGDPQQRMLQPIALRATVPVQVLQVSLFKDLPHMQQLQLKCEDNWDFNAQQLINVLAEMCAQAEGPSVLSLPDSVTFWLPGTDSWKAQLRAAMRAAGHEHVKLEGFDGLHADGSD